MARLGSSCAMSKGGGEYAEFRGIGWGLLSVICFLDKVLVVIGYLGPDLSSGDLFAMPVIVANLGFLALGEASLFD